ncbi:MAG: hypothetical protein NTY19_52465 [Planctomycetota bacterium]|nr:hypothetical protein [Planctomycetota bacterium]
MSDARSNAIDVPEVGAVGIRLEGLTVRDVEAAKQDFWSRLRDLELEKYVQTTDDHGADPPGVGFRLWADLAEDLAPAGDTTRLCEKLRLDTTADLRDLEQEILLALLRSPIPYVFPSYGELASAVRIRMNIVEATRKTGMTFGTGEAVRPTDYWRYDEDQGFLLVPGQSLVTALRVATQPGGSETTYTFSCRRAVEFIVLLAVAEELQTCNPDLYRKLTQQFQTRAIKGEEFETVFLRPIGSASKPFPLWFFVPGDWVWFKNPDPVSAEIPGFEGSHTIYLGGGLVPDFWSEGETSHLTMKYLRIFYWRQGVFKDAQGELQMDDVKAEDLAQQVLGDPTEVERILQEMVHLQGPRGEVGYGCIEPTRDFQRLVCPGTADLVLPEGA